MTISHYPKFKNFKIHVFSLFENMTKKFVHHGVVIYGKWMVSSFGS